MSPKERKGPVASCVKQTLERYFNDLNGEKVTDVYDMILHEVEKPMLEIVIGLELKEAARQLRKIVGPGGGLPQEIAQPRPERLLPAPGLQGRPL